MENGGSLITLDLSMLIQVINFLILFYAFWRLFGKKIGPILDERKKIVTSKLAEAEENWRAAHPNQLEESYVEKI